MGDPGGEAQQHRGVEPFGELVGQFRIGQALRRIDGFEHRHLGRDGVVPGILFVLGGVHTRIVGHGTDHAATNPDVRGGVEGVGGDVEADMLHRAEAAGAAGGRAEGHLKGHLFVGRPFRVDFAVLYGGFGDLGTGGTGIGGEDGDAGLVESAGNGLVAQ